MYYIDLSTAIMYSAKFGYVSIVAHTMANCMAANFHESSLFDMDGNYLVILAISTEFNYSFHIEAS